jgi:hypothetical protein
MGWNSEDVIATHYMLRYRIPVEAIFSAPVQSLGPPSILERTMGTGSWQGGKATGSWL